MPTPWLRRFLDVYWLRPENALWRAVNCAAIEDIVFEPPVADLACGDGIFSFLRAGGQLDEAFDIFEGVGSLDRFFENADIYDAAPDNYRPVVARLPDYRIDVGTDHKPNLLAKAEKLDVYDRLVEHDNNEPLPFDDGAFRTIFSNSVYWVENVELHLREIARVLDPSGLAVLVLKNSAILDYTLAAYEGQLGRGWLDFVDRGRAESYRGLRSEPEWRGLLDEAGLDLVEARPQVSWVHAHLWDVGLRPLSPVLIAATSALEPDRRLELKRQWVDVWERLLEPFARPGFDLGRARPAPEVIYLLRPKGA